MNMNATILGQAIAFILFVWFCMKYVWPPLMAAIEKRQKEIADEDHRVADYHTISCSAANSCCASSCCHSAIAGDSCDDNTKG